MRLLIIQYAGDYRAAYARAAAGEETYYGHRYVLQVAQHLSERAQVTLLCCRTDEAYSETLPTGVRVVGAATDPSRADASFRRMLDGLNPTHVVILAPMQEIMDWALASRRRRVLCVFADSFEMDLFRRAAKIRQLRRLTRTLNDPRVEWIGNHNVPASRSIAGLGVDPAKVVPWDWPHPESPDAGSKNAEGHRPTLLYVGAVTKPKGVWDLIKASVLARRLGVSVSLTIVGSGDVDAARSYAVRCGASDFTDFVGLATNRDVQERMRSAWAVVVPSQRRYPEALPLTIYEALAARTPIIASDHPMIAACLSHREEALLFRNGNASSLARQVYCLATEAGLYQHLSSSSLSAWRKLQVSTKWGDLIDHWLSGSANDTDWIAARTLSQLH